MNKRHEKILISKGRKGRIRFNKRKYIVNIDKFKEMFNKPITYDRVVIDPR